MEMNARYTSFVAVGDSFTEGMSDGLPDGSYRGWADLLAARLATAARTSPGGPEATPAFRYANLAVRGKLIGQIADEQCGPAAAMGADLVTLVGGLNDVLRPTCDVDQVCARSSGDGRTGAQFSAELGKAFWATPADHTNPGPVTDWRRVWP
ncbi:SGNH/GDSL hydrolase family protein [Streptomyces tubercidicus]|uniref:SGNH/GDSL hydrolase family protein n=1 Tax=Streptomyces tubercidicus TaxID=47759 RepID=UPI0036B34960